MNGGSTAITERAGLRPWHRVVMPGAVMPVASLFPSAGGTRHGKRHELAPGGPVAAT